MPLIISTNECECVFALYSDTDYEIITLPPNSNLNSGFPNAVEVESIDEAVDFLTKKGFEGVEAILEQDLSILEEDDEEIEQENTTTTTTTTIEEVQR